MSNKAHSVNLFLGFVNSNFAKELIAESNTHLVKMFFNSSEYLQMIHHKDIEYIGKWIDSPVECDDLTDISIHIRSILLKVLPKVDVSNFPLQILAIPSIPSAYVSYTS